MNGFPKKTVEKQISKHSSGNYGQESRNDD